MTRKMVGILCALFALSWIFVSFAFAADEASVSDMKKYFALAAGLAIGIAACGGGIGQGIAINGGLHGISRNPEAQPKIFVAMIVGLALIESLVIYALVISILLYAKL
jgi:F-type H+-transporting ATPase subunit c